MNKADIDRPLGGGTDREVVLGYPGGDLAEHLHQHELAAAWSAMAKRRGVKLTKLVRDLLNWSDRWAMHREMYQEFDVILSRQKEQNDQLENL